MLGCFDFLMLRWSFVTGAVSGWESYRWYSCDSFGRSIRGGADWHIAQIPCRGRLLVSFEKNHNPNKDAHVTLINGMESIETVQGCGLVALHFTWSDLTDDGASAFAQHLCNQPKLRQGSWADMAKSASQGTLEALGERHGKKRLGRSHSCCKQQSFEEFWR